MKSAALISLLAVMLFVVVRGQPGKCQCRDEGTNVIYPKRIQRLQVFPPSPSCPNMEIIVTLKDNGGQKCLNPESTFAKNYIKHATKTRECEVNCSGQVQ